MRINENIIKLIKERGLNRREFADKLISLEPTITRTLEVPTVSTVYGYLNGRINIPLDLITYIAEVLNVTEQQIFDNSTKTRIKYLSYILENPTKKEIQLIKNKILVKEINIQNSILTDVNNGSIQINSQNLEYEFKEILQLLQYAPIPFLQKLTQKLKVIKKESDDF